MSWAKLDDQFFVNRKARAAGLEGRSLFLASVCYCAMQQNDGCFPVGDLEVVAAMAGVPQDIAERLVTIGLWHATEGGYEVHEYLKYNPSREQVVARKERAEKAANSRHHPATSNATSTAPGNANAVPLPSPSPSPKTSSSSSSSDLRGLPPDLWMRIAEKQAQQTTSQIANPAAWKRKAASNAQADLEQRAVALVERYDLTPSQLADALTAPSNPPWLNHHLRRDTA
ncbi:MAG: hypothetical protein ACOYXR_09220 [Nitrospirota bacterium]